MTDPHNRGNGEGGPVYWYLRVLGKYATFDGRARRREYWMFILGHTVVSFVIEIVSVLAGTKIPGHLYLLVILVPSIAVAVRRLHDTGHSGWWMWALFVNLIFLLEDGEPGWNRFGYNPKEWDS